MDTSGRRPAKRRRARRSGFAECSRVHTLAQTLNPRQARRAGWTPAGGGPPSEDEHDARASRNAPEFTRTPRDPRAEEGISSAAGPPSRRRGSRSASSAGIASRAVWRPSCGMRADVGHGCGIVVRSPMVRGEGARKQLAPPLPCRMSRRSLPLTASVSVRLTVPTSSMRAACSSGLHVKNVGTTRRVITNTCPGDTGNESKIAK